MMKRIQESGGTLYQPAKAATIQADYAAADPDWTYTVEDYGNGWARVRIDDEDGEFVGYAEAA